MEAVYTEMLRTLFSLCSVLLAIATIVLLHSADILGSCKEVTDNAFGLAYTNAVVWMALFLFLCLPFLRSIAKMIYVNALPALVGTVSSFAVVATVNGMIDDCDEQSRRNLLLTSLCNALLALLLFLSEISCPKRTASYEELQ